MTHPSDIPPDLMNDCDPIGEPEQTWDHELSRWVPAYRQTRWDPATAEATSSSTLDQPEGGAGYTAVEPDLSTQEPCARQYEHGGHHYWRPGVTGRSFTCPGRHDAGPVLDEEAARGQIAAIIAMSDDGTDMLNEIMAGPVATLVRDARARVVHELLGTADLATGNWVLGDAAGVVHTALVGAAHELDHPDCEDSTIAHLAEWRAAWVAGRESR